MSDKLSEKIACPVCRNGGYCELCYGAEQITAERILWLYQDYVRLRTSVQEFVRTCGVS
jgi:hypothetical protein